MQPFTEQDFINRFNNQKEWGLAAATKLGQRIIDKTKWFEQPNLKPPFVIADINTLFIHVKLLYTGTFGDIMSFALVDLNSPEGGAHFYHKEFLGDTGAFFMELVREMGYITSLHFE